MSSGRRDGKHASGFAEWVREQRELDSRIEGFSLLDIDWIWHQYRVSNDKFGERKVNHMMLIEEKSYGADLSFSQRDTMWITHQMIGKPRAQFVTTVRGDRVKVKYWGYHKLRYEGNRPDTSEWIMWDKKIVSISQLIRILRFDVDPDHFRKIDSRLCHNAQTQMCMFP